MIRRNALWFIVSTAVAALMFAAVQGMEGIGKPIPALLASGMFLLSSLVLRFPLTADNETLGKAPDEGFVSVVIPVYNEEPELLRLGLKSIASQTRRPDRVWVIDDGSSSSECAELARQWAAEQTAGHRKDRIDVHVFVQSHNSGKRRSLVHAFENDADADIFFTMDSDTILDPQALEQGLLAFRDPQVFGMAGVLFGHNRQLNGLTRIIEMEFTCGFLVNRAIMSRFGSVLVTCGSLAAYRAEVCREHTQELLDEQFLGVPVFNGDDRRLTQFALMRGKVVLQQSCIGRVALPQSLSHLFRQRTRWSTSFFRGTFYILRNMPPNRAAFWLTLVHAGTFCLQSIALLVALIFGSKLGWFNLAMVLIAVSVPGIVTRHTVYWKSNGVDRAAASTIEFQSLSTLASLLTLLIFVPARYYALFHLRSNQWRTRRAVEAVTLKPDGDDD